MISPWREWDLTSRSKLISYAESKGIAVPQGKRNDPPFSTDANLLHISYEGWDTPLHIASHVDGGLWDDSPAFPCMKQLDLLMHCGACIAERSIIQSPSPQSVSKFCMGSSLSLVCAVQERPGGPVAGAKSGHVHAQRVPRAGA